MLNEIDSTNFTNKYFYDLNDELEFHRCSRKYLTNEQYRKLKRYYRSLDSQTVKYTAYCEGRMLARAKDYFRDYNSQ